MVNTIMNRQNSNSQKPTGSSFAIISKSVDHGASRQDFIDRSGCCTPAALPNLLWTLLAQRTSSQRE
jgi:hypothetical protein